MNFAASKTNVQVGIVNGAEATDFSFGLLNVLYAGRVHVDLRSTETGFMHAALKHGGRWFHNIYGVGARARGPQASLAYGIGAHLLIASDLHVDVDLLGHAIVPAADDSDPVPLLASLRVVLNGSLQRDVSLFGGFSYNALWTHERDRGASYPLVGAHELASPGRATLLGWPGLVLGLQLIGEDTSPPD